MNISPLGNFFIIITPSLTILIITYFVTLKLLEKKAQEFKKERELLEKLKQEDNFTIEFEENESKNNIENTTLRQNQVENSNKKTYKELKKEWEQKGREFELKVKEYFENKGYQVIDHSGVRGKKDEGIDLIAINDVNGEFFCIQCKNWQKKKINHNHIKQFLSDYIIFLKKHKNEVKKYKNRKFILAIPGRILTKSAYARIKQNSDIIDFVIVD